MALEVKHEFESPKSDGGDPSLLQPSYWNAPHVITVPANRLVGNSVNSEGNAEAIQAVGLALEDGKLTNPVAGADGFDVVLGTAPEDDALVPNARVATDTSTVVWDKDTPKQIKARIAPGAQGEILYYGPGGAPLRLTPGDDGQVLQSKGAGANPVWSYAGAPAAVIYGKSTTTEGAFASGAWRKRLLDTQLYDLPDIIESLTSNQIELKAGTYVVEWSAPAWQVNQHQTRLYNATDAVSLGVGTSEYAYADADDHASQTRSTGIAKFTLAATKKIELQHQCQTTNSGNGFGISVGWDTTDQPSIFSIVKIWKVS